MRYLILLVPTIVVIFACSAPTVAPLAAPDEASVNPGINERFVSPELDMDWALGTFESESREIFVHRHEIVEHLGLSAGVAVADVGAGTGLFIEPFAREVGVEGKLYAADISQKFVDYMRTRVSAAGLTQVEVVLSTERSVELPEGSIDVAFVCDTYHHFEYPRSMLASLHAALRPGGRLVIVDFERIPGVSRDWVLDHVRAGKDVVTAEIVAAGFTIEDEPEVVGLRENYLLRFRRP